MPCRERRHGVYSAHTAKHEDEPPLPPKTTPDQGAPGGGCAEPLLTAKRAIQGAAAAYSDRREQETAAQPTKPHSPLSNDASSGEHILCVLLHRPADPRVHSPSCLHRSQPNQQNAAQPASCRRICRRGSCWLHQHAPRTCPLLLGGRFSALTTTLWWSGPRQTVRACCAAAGQGKHTPTWLCSN